VLYQLAFLHFWCLASYIYIYICRLKKIKNSLLRLFKSEVKFNRNFINLMVKVYVRIQMEMMLEIALGMK
jgi:hypothetical protein